jgi:hypothetical protein
MSTGAPLNLTLEPSGYVGWTDAVNANFTGINAAIAALQAGGTTGAPGNPGAPGAVGIIWAGPWGSGTPYVATDAVSFNNSSYIALASNTGVAPDTHPSTWALIALAGVQGIQGIQGIQGPPGSGGGSSVTFPITVVEGGTGAGDAIDARTNLGAASSGANNDITALSALPGVSIQSSFISVTNVPPDANGCTILPNVIECPNGELLIANISCASEILLGGSAYITSASRVNLGNSFGPYNPNVAVNNGLIVGGATPTVSSGQVGLAGQTAGTASAGGGQAPPATVLGYWIVDMGGTLVKFAYFAP